MKLLAFEIRHQLLALLVAASLVPIFATVSILYVLVDTQLEDEAKIQAEQIHSRIRQTFATFSHLLEEDEKHLNEQLDSALDQLARTIAKNGRPIDSYTTAELDTLAKNLWVDDIYLIDKTTTVVATNYPPDLSFKLDTISESLGNLLHTIYRQNRKVTDRINISTHTNIIKKYAYYSPDDADYILEVAVDIRKIIRKKYGTRFEEFLFNDLFRDIGKDNAHLKSIDLYRVNALRILNFFADSKPLPQNVLLNLEKKSILIARNGSMWDMFSKMPISDNYSYESEYWVVHSTFDRSAFLVTRDIAIQVNTTVYGITAIFVFIAGYWFLQRHFTRRLLQIGATLEQITCGHYDHIIPIDGNDEFDRIATHINSMQRLIGEREEQTININQYLEQKVSERTEELRLAKEDAETANALKSHFVTNISHEIRTPMNAIIGFAQLTLESEIAEESRQRVHKIVTSTHHLLGILNDILDFSKIEAGKLELEQIPFNFHEELQRVLDIVTTQAKEKGLFLNVDIDSAIPAILVGDPLRLKQIILNILNNAIKFTTKGGISIRVEGLSFYKKSKYYTLRFTIKDTGNGLLPEQKERIFKQFNPIDNSDIKLHGGTGIGLTICARLIAMMGGNINVESEYGEGSIFWFTVHLGWIEQDIQQINKPIVDLSLDTMSKLLKDKRILLVEDNILNQELALILLSKVGIKTDIVCNGAEAINKVQPGYYDLILMDCEMPVMDGYEATRRLRNNPLLAKLPIIAMTAHVMTEDLDKCLAAGMNDRIIKPIEFKSFFCVLAHWLTHQGFSILSDDLIAEKSEKNGVKPIRKINMVNAIQSMGLDKAIYLEILRVFLLEAEHFLEQFRQTMKEGDIGSVLRYAHALKSTAGSIGASALKELAAELEIACREASFAQMDACLYPVELELTQVISEARNILDDEVTS